MATVVVTQADPQFHKRAQQALVDAMNATDEHGALTPAARLLRKTYYKAPYTTADGTVTVNRRSRTATFPVLDANGAPAQVVVPMVRASQDHVLQAVQDTPVPGAVLATESLPFTGNADPALDISPELLEDLTWTTEDWHNRTTPGEHFGEVYAEHMLQVLSARYPGEQILRVYTAETGAGTFDQLYVRVADGTVAGWVIIEAKSVHGEIGSRWGNDDRRYEQGHPDYVRKVAEIVAGRDGEAGPRYTAAKPFIDEFVGPLERGRPVPGPGRPPIAAQLDGGRAVADSILEALQANKVEYAAVYPDLDSAGRPRGVRIVHYDMAQATPGYVEGRVLGALSPTDGAAAQVPNSRFGQGRRVADPFTVDGEARAALPSVAEDAGVNRIVRASDGSFVVTMRDGRTFVVRLESGPVPGGEVAVFTVDSAARSAVIRVADRATTDVIARALAHEIAELSQIFGGNTVDSDVLTPAREPGDRLELSPHDRGREAELRALDRAEREAGRLRVLRRRYLRAEMRALMEHLGLHPDQAAARQRTALLSPDVAEIVERRARPRGAPADPNGLPSWRAYVNTKLATDLTPGAGASVVLGFSVSPMVGIGVAAGAAVQALTAGVVERWFAVRELTAFEELTEFEGSRRAHEQGQQRKAVLDSLLARANDDVVVDEALVPAEPRQAGERPAGIPAWWASVVRRAVPGFVGSSAITSLIPLGVPPVLALGSWAAVTAAAALVPLADRYKARREHVALLAQAEEQAAALAARDAALEAALAADLHGLMDRIDRLRGMLPARTELPTAPADDSDGATRKPGLGTYLIGGLADGGGQVARQVAGAADKIAPDLLGKLALQSDNLILGASRAIAGALAAAFVDRAWNRIDTAAATDRETFDATRDQTEDHVRKWELTQLLLAEANRQVEEAERLVAEQRRIRSSLRGRTVDLLRGWLHPGSAPATPQSDQPQSDRTQPDQPQSDQPQSDQPQSDQAQPDRTQQSESSERRAAEPAPARPLAERPPGMPPLGAYVVKASVPGGIAVGVASVLAEVLGLPGFVVGATAAAAGGESLSSVAQWLQKRAELLAGDAKTEVERGSEQDRQAAAAAATGRFVHEFLQRELAAAQQQANPAPRRPPRLRALLAEVKARLKSAIPVIVLPSDPRYPAFIASAVERATQRLWVEPRPWSTLPARLTALDDIGRLAARVRLFAEHAERTGNARPHGVARDDLTAAIKAYRDLLAESGLPINFP
ncbi:hypothetical protein [Actinokineospora sp.]|uniref:hypothetical protein n=1 Tax=Actinokineospora sp. TaxID=1872133 RepID=UPI004037F17C